MSLDALKIYVADKMPLLDAQMSLLPLNQVRQVLNAATGLNEQPLGSVHEGGARFLAALRESERKGTLTLQTLPLAIAALATLRK